MHQNYYATALLAILRLFLKQRPAAPPLAEVAAWGIGQGILRTDVPGWWMKLFPGNTLVQIWPQAGTGGDFPNPFVIWVSGSAPAGGDGKIGTPFQLIQDGINAAADNAASIIMIGPGTYTENLVAAGLGRQIILCGVGAWQLNGNISWGIGAPSATVPMLWIGGLSGGEADEASVASGSMATINGNIVVLGPLVGPTKPLVLGGTFDLLGNLDGTSAATCAPRIFLRNARIRGLVNTSSATLYSADATSFEQAVTLWRLGRVTHSDFAVSLQATGFAGPGSPLPHGLFGCSFGAGSTFTGPAGIGRMDGSSYKSFLDAGAIFGGAATLDLIEEGLAPQTEYTPTTLSDWDGPPPVPWDVASALDQLASRVRVLETTPTSGPLIETFNCGAWVTVGDAVYVAAGVRTVDQAIATSQATAPAIGFVIAKPTPVTCRVQMNGSFILPLGHPALPLVPLRTYYVDLALPGNIIPVIPPPPPWPPVPPWATGNIVQEIGIAIGPGELLIQIDRDFSEL